MTEKNNQEELIEGWEDYKKYYASTYSYKTLADKRKDEKEDETLKIKKNLDDKSKQDAEEDKIYEEMNDYLEDVEDIRYKCEREIIKNEENIDAFKVKADNETDTDKKTNYQKKLEHYKNEETRIKSKYEKKLKLLNLSLSSKAKQKLKAEKDFKEDIDTLLDESLLNTSSNLTKLEENLIFGNTFDIIEEATLINESTLTSAGNLNAATKNVQTAQNQLNKLTPGTPKYIEQKRLVDNAKRSQNAVETSLIQDNAIKKNKAQTDALSGEVIKEAIEEEQPTSPEATEKAAEDRAEITTNAQIGNLEKQKEKVRENSEKKIESIDSRIEKIRARLQIFKNRNKMKNLAEETILEKVEEADPLNPKNKIDFMKFSDTIFEGDSGKVLRYLIKGETNGIEIKNISIAQVMKSKPEVQEIIKKIEFYLKKASSGLSYEQTIELKVLKGKFRELFKSTKKEYENRYKK